MEINELLDQAKHRANLKSDYALAKVIGVPTGTVAHWRKGNRHPSTDEAVKLATLAGIEDMQVIAEIEMRTANSEKKKEFWKSYLESRGIVATLGMIGLGLSIIVTPEPASANVLQFVNYGAHSHVQETKGIYIMRITEGKGLGGGLIMLEYSPPIPS